MAVQTIKYLTSKVNNPSIKLDRVINRQDTQRCAETSNQKNESHRDKDRKRHGGLLVTIMQQARLRSLKKITLKLKAQNVNHRAAQKY
jgi:hypothetical protein